MGLFKMWKDAKAVAASGSPGGRLPPGGGGMAMGFAGAMMKMMGPMMASQAPERGKPLPGTEAGVSDHQDAGAIQTALAALRARDSAFDPQVLTTFADQVFAAVSSAWGSGDPAPIRPILSDDVWEPLAATLTSGFGAGAGELYSHQTGRASLAGLWAGTWYDTARFDIAVRVDLPPDPHHPTPPGLTSWNEEWLFQRSVRPGGDPMIAAETCPSCGAASATDGSGLCAHCHQAIPVFTTGWLVTYIRSHNPTVATFQSQIVASVRQDPTTLRKLPDEVVRLLPPEVVAEIDPPRAAALGLHPSQ